MTPIPGNNATVRPFAGGTVMTSPDNPPSPDQAGVWEPDVHELIRVWFEREDAEDYPSDMKDVVSEYRRQQAERGVVEIRRSDLQVMADNMRSQYAYPDDVLSRVDALLSRKGV